MDTAIMWPVSVLVVTLVWAHAWWLQRGIARRAVESLQRALTESDQREKQVVDELRALHESVEPTADRIAYLQAQIDEERARLAEVVAANVRIQAERDALRTRADADAAGFQAGQQMLLRLVHELWRRLLSQAAKHGDPPPAMPSDLRALMRGFEVDAKAEET